MEDHLFDEVAAEASGVPTNGQEASNNRRPGRQMADTGGARGRWDFSHCEVKAWFESHEHYGRQLGENRSKHTVLCPWEHEHQGRPVSIDTDTVIYAGTDTRPAAFVCKHAHCAKRTLA